MRERFSQIIRSFKPEDEPELPVRFFRLVSATTAVLCLAVVLPINLLQDLPWGVNVGDVLLGLLAGWFYQSSLHGRHYFMGFFVVLFLLLDPVWFLNAGSVGSVSYYFFPVLLYPLAVFQGRRRWLLAGFVLINFWILLLVEYRYPALTIPFKTPTDKFLDVASGAACSLLGLGVLIWLVVSSYEREQARISLYARELAAKEENYRAIFNSTSDALIISDATGRLIDVNTSMCAMYGCDHAAALATTVQQLSQGEPPYSAAEAREKLAQALKDGPQVFLWRSRRINGKLFWSEVALRAADIAGQKRLIAVVRDISARIQAEEALRTNEERLRLALAASDQGWFDLNVVTGEGIASGEYARIIGLEPVEFKVTAQNWLEGIHPEDRALMLREFQACISEGGTRTMEYRRQTKTGEWKWIRSTGSIVEREVGGRALRMAGTHADITERKLLEARLLHSQRLESVGTLAGGVAHDLNNILTPMLMVGAVLREKLSDPDDRALFDQVESGARRGAAIVRQLLTFSRDLPQTRTAVDVGRLMAEMLEIMRGTFPREITLVVRVPDGLWPVTADPIQLHQVLMNLCINARDAMPGGGTLELTAENLPAARATSGGEPAPAVRLTVGDTGHGIPPEIKGRIFDPFFTTKGVGEGTGLGLSTVHGIVLSHGGTVTVESELTRGSRFHVILPASATAPETPAVPAPPPQPVRRRPLVVVIDDEPGVLAVTVRILSQAGCDVFPANGSDQAREFFASRAGAVDLVLTDLMMPGMDGLKLVPLLRQAAPQLKVIGVSGLDYSQRQAEMEALGFAEVMRKPYDTPTLLAAVHRHLPAAHTL